MKPRDLLLSHLEPKVVPALEKLGFRFSKSSMKFSKKCGHATQTILISSSHWNSTKNCTFWSVLAANSKEYANWCKDQFKEPEPTGMLGGCSNWNLPGWPRKASELFTLNKSFNDAVEIDIFRSSIISIGVPYLDLISTWEGAAQELLRWQWNHDRACDYFIIAGRPDMAKAALLQGISDYSKSSGPNSERVLQRIHSRLQKFFP